jgi:hypothetical protein
MIVSSHNRIRKIAVLAVVVLTLVAGLFVLGLSPDRTTAVPIQPSSPAGLPASAAVAASPAIPALASVKGRRVQITIDGERLGKRATIVLQGRRGKAAGASRTVRVGESKTVKRLQPGRYRISAKNISRNGQLSKASAITPQTVRVRKQRGATTSVSYQVADPSETPRTVPIIDRLAWGALPARRGMDRHTPKRLTLHHSAVESGNFDGPSRVRAHQRFHMDQHKDSEDIMYHFVVDRLGNIYQARNPKYRGGTMTTYNTRGHFLVDLDGDFQQNQEPTAAQIKAGADLFAYAAGRWNIDPATLAGHRDYAQTTCPGDALYRHISSGRLKRMIQQRLDTGGINLELMPTWQGRNLIDQIETRQAQPVR